MSEANKSGHERRAGGQSDPRAVALSFAAVPVYDYRCERCTSQFEMRQSFSDDTLSVCPPQGGPASCVSPGEGPVKKVFSGVAIAFKGDGFYKNDHGSIAQDRRKEKASSNGASESKDSSSKDSSESKSSSSKDSSSSSSDSGSKSGADSASGRSKADAGASSSSTS